MISKSNGIPQSQGYNTGLSCSTILVYPALPYWPILLIAYFFHKVRARGIHQGSSATDSVTGRKRHLLKVLVCLFTESGCHFLWCRVTEVRASHVQGK